jgi:putative peptidoglycan lipid II flippase
MQAATFLIQFPGGLVGSALAFAVLPTLTTFIREENIERFKSTLLLGFRLGLLLMIPAMAGLIVLQLPIVKLLYQHGNKVTNDQMLLTARALQYYSLQLPFLAIDQLLIAAFYARKNTIIPVLAYVVGAVGYVVVAVPFWHNYGVSALTIANSVQNSVHAVFLLIVLRRVVGSLHLRSMIPAVGKILVATAVLVLVAGGLQWIFAQSHLSIVSLDSFVGRLLIVVIAGGLATVAYFAVAIVLRIEEVALLKGAVLAKLGKR